MKRYIIAILLLNVFWSVYSQNTMQSPVEVGSKSTSFTYTSTLNTANYTNNYVGKSSNDVFYKFTLTKAMEVTVSHCGSELSDTYLSLLDASGNRIAYNDDYSGVGKCANTYHSYLKQVLPTGTYYVVSEGYSQNGNITTSIAGNLAPVTALPVTDIGSKNASFAYENTLNTGNAANYYVGRSSNDVLYKFTLAEPMEIFISHCGSEVSDTYLHLLDVSGNLIESNDDYSGAGKCAKTTHSYLKRELAAGTYYAVSEGFSQNGNITTSITGVVSLANSLRSSQENESEDHNYIATRTYTKDDGSTYMDAIQYFDGLGRPNQTVQIGITPQQKDLVTIQEYDAFGRESKAWLPINTTSKSGNFREMDNLKTRTNTVYGTEPIRYSESVYEPSPLNRIEKQYGPGQAWRAGNNGQGHPVKMEYLTNSAADPCALYSVSGNNLVRNGNYANNSLYVTKTLDEDNKVFYEFKDKLGRVVLQRQLLWGSNKHDTYYVYDDLGNKRFVLPPLAADSTGGGTYTEADRVMKNYAYLYRYDERNRCIWQKLPGADPIEYVYDKADRLIFSQDGEQRPTNNWTFYKYDAFNRMILTGVWKNSGKTQANLVSQYQNTVATEQFSSAGAYGYTWTALSWIPSSAVLQANYYDNYSFKTIAPFNSNTAYNYTTTPNGFSNKRYGTETDAVTTKGLLTGSITVLLDNPDTKLGSVFYYDSKGQMIQSVSQNHLSGYEKEYLNYSFTGQPTWKKHIHSAAGKPNIEETYTYGYDHANRPTTTHYKLNTDAEILLSHLTYDEVGRVANKTIGNNTESISYAYNIRSWLKNISSVNFGQTLYYEDGNSHLYNGNISSAAFRLPPGYTGFLPFAEYTFSYAYDDLNRLTLANSTQDFFDEEFRHDKHGNITQLWRTFYDADYGYYNMMDDLYLEYNGNQLKHVSEDPSSTFGLVKHPGYTMNEYGYNKNGAMTKDYNTGITDIQYNWLNLPQKIQFGMEHATENTYDAMGIKRQTRHTTKTGFWCAEVNEEGEEISTSWQTETSNTLTTNYCGNIIYENNALKYILNPEGYTTKATNGTLSYHYYLRDHLGNNRIVLKKEGNVQIEQVMNYYPSGMPFPENYGAEKQPYKFGGKEYDEMFGLNWYHQGFRPFGAVIPRTPTPDPMQEKDYSTSPYVQYGNNPVNRIDPDGRDDYGLDEVIRRLSLIRRTDDKTDLVSTGAFDDNGVFTANDQANSMIFISKGVLNAKNEQQDLSKTGFTTTGDNQADGVNLMDFISRQTHTELAALGYATTDGKSELIVGSWDNTSLYGSTTPKFNEKGSVQFDIHTHPIGMGNTGYGVAGTKDLNGQAIYPAYYILSQRNGLTQYYPQGSTRERTEQERSALTKYPHASTLPNSLKKHLRVTP